MRDEMLKRLDELMEVVLTEPSIPAAVSLRYRTCRWHGLRAELAAEKCGNCEHYENPGCSSVDDSISISVAPDFCCSHFTPKTKEPAK